MSESLTEYQPVRVHRVNDKGSDDADECLVGTRHLLRRGQEDNKGDEGEEKAGKVREEGGGEGGGS